jgi:hypothetical protein
MLDKSRAERVGEALVLPLGRLLQDGDMLGERVRIRHDCGRSGRMHWREASFGLEGAVVKQAA